MHDRVYQYLGLNGKTSAKKLANFFQIGERQIRRTIQEARQFDYPICSDMHGFWLGDRAEVNATADAMESVAMSLMQTVEGLRRSAERLG